MRKEIDKRLRERWIEEVQPLIDRNEHAKTHEKADELMSSTLRELGYIYVANLYDDMMKFYE